MKKIFCALFLALVCFGHVWASSSHSTHYGKVVAVTKGNGTVYLSTSSSTKTGGKESASTAGASDQQTWNCGGSSGSDSKTYYACATPNEGDYFAGWSTSSTTNEKKSEEKMYYSVAGSASGGTQSAPKTTTVYAYFELTPEASVTLLCPDATMGALKYTCDGVTKTITEKTTIKTKKAFKFTAILQPGYKVLRWWISEDGGTTKSTLGTVIDHLDNQSFLNDCLIGVDIIPSSTPVFQIKGKDQVYTSLIDANNAAASGNVIALVSDGTLTAGEYEIKSGVTLFIPPYNYNGSIPTTAPVVWDKHGHERNGTYYDYSLGKSGSEPSNDQSVVFRHLVFDKGATLTVYGTLAIGGARWITTGNTGQTTTSGDFRMDKEYGLITLNAGSSITLNNSSYIYCWGRIRGEGTITANSGSKVYESFVYMDHRELEAYGEIADDKKTFLMNQYYVQDIQVPITFNYGAQEFLSTAFFHYSKDAPDCRSFNFIGNNGSNSLFELPSGATITKRYNVEKDRLEFDLKGANMNQFKVTLKVSIFEKTYSTSENILTITNNWSLNVLSGTTTIQQSLHFAPGAELNISEGAAVNVATGKELYIYDKNDWGKFACNNTIIPLFLPSYELSNNYYTNHNITTTNVSCKGGGTYKAIRTPNNMTHATVLVNGTLNMNGGLYTTFSGTANDGRGANICSDGGGIITFNAAQGSTTTITELFGCARNTDVPQTTSVNVQPALLHNVNNNDPANTIGTYTSTAGAAANTTYKYVASISKWGKVSTVTFKNGDDTFQSAQLAEGEAVTVPATDPSKSGYTFLGWGNVAQTMPGSDVTYTAQWSKNIASIDVKEDEVVTVDDQSTESTTGINNNTYVVGESTTVTNSVTIENNTTLEVSSDVTLNANEVYVEIGGTLNVETSSTVEITTVTLNATPSDVSIDDEYAGTSSQIKGKGDITVKNAYIDINMDASGTLNGSNYYAFAVPFNVKVDGGVQKNINGALSPAVLDKDFRAYTYNGVNRADNGKGSNWTMVDKDGMFQPGVFYLVEFADGSCNTFRFTKVSGVENPLNNAANIDVTKYTGSADATNWGWNGIANNALENATFTLLNSDDKAQVFNPAKKIFETVPLSTTFSIATPLMVQTGTTGDVINSAATTSSSTPVRMLAQTDNKTFGEYTVRIKAEGAAKTADQMFISASENASTSYMIGKDLVKMFMGNAAVAQLWVNDYGKKLSVNQAVLTDNVATASLTLYAPKAGNYTVYLKDIPEDATIYLLEKGEAIADLNDGAFTVALDKGENTQYGLRINTKTIPGVITSMDEALVSGKVAQKVLMDGVVYIVRDGKLYNMFGQQR